MYDPLTDADIDVLRIIGRGHPDRTMTAKYRYGSRQVPALTFDEVQIAARIPFNEFIECIAHLVSHDLIEAGTQHPTLFGRMRGQDGTSVYWILDAGRALLNLRFDD